MKAGSQRPSHGERKLSSSAQDGTAQEVCVSQHLFPSPHLEVLNNGNGEKMD